MLKMPKINQLAISGIISGDPVQRDGYLELTVACRRSYRNKAGEWVEEISYVQAHVKTKPIEHRAGQGDVPYPGPLAEGLPVFITGRIRSQPPEHTSLRMEVRNIQVLKDQPDDEEEPGQTA